jgi:hypothetical protein
MPSLEKPLSEMHSGGRDGSIPFSSINKISTFWSRTASDKDTVRNLSEVSQGECTIRFGLYSGGRVVASELQAVFLMALQLT